MSTYTTPIYHTPPAMITHSVASIRGQQTADISVHHARTPDARIAVTFGGMLLVLYSCSASQGLLEAFAAARGHLNHVPAEIPAASAGLGEPGARATLFDRMDTTHRLRRGPPVRSEQAENGPGALD